MAEDVFGIVGTTQGGAFQVESVVAEGGFGVVYRAYHGAFRAPVALKCLKIPQSLTAKGQADFLERFREEAELMFRLSAGIPAVARPLHVDVITTANGQFVPYMALEWLEGESLDVLIQTRHQKGRPPLAIKRAVRLLTPVARALDAAHNFPAPGGATVSIVHRDLKPDNIFIADLNGEQTSKILDFGIAKVRNTATAIAGRASQSDGQAIAFTPGYGAPEQWLPKRFGQTGPWTDVWGMALTLVETIVGRPIIEGDLAGMMGTAIDEARRPTPRTEGVVVSDEVEAVFLRALAVDPRLRQQDCGEFWDELELALGLERSFAPIGRKDRRADGGGGAPREEHVGGRFSRAPGAGSMSPGSADEPSRPGVPPPGGFFQDRLAGRPAPSTVQGLPLEATAIDRTPPPSAIGAALGAPPAVPSAPPQQVPTLAPRPFTTPPSPRDFETPLPAAAPVAPVAPASPPASPPARPPPQSPTVGGLLQFGEDPEPLDGGGPGDDDLTLDLDPRSGPISIRAPRTTPQVPVGTLERTSMSRITPSRSPSARPGTSRTQDLEDAGAAGALRKKLGVPAAIAVAGIALAMIDRVITQANDGVALALGPVTLTWVASGTALVGTTLLVWRLFWPSEE